MEHEDEMISARGMASSAINGVRTSFEQHFNGFSIPQATPGAMKDLEEMVGRCYEKGGYLPSCLVAFVPWDGSGGVQSPSSLPSASLTTLTTRPEYEKLEYDLIPQARRHLRPASHLQRVCSLKIPLPQAASFISFKLDQNTFDQARVH
ncbi:hypothetical protein NMY22_g19873 [Coprinellus aureogranulatus]|nr:hypothetical protein NMY22_g19873 [Coprinellus aureogranulatus]